jgi:dihydroorotase-like cyclic amidohydrolase
MAAKTAEKTPVQILFQDEELAAIDQYRRMQANPPTRPQAIRDVLRNALGRSDGSAGIVVHA